MSLRFLSAAIRRFTYIGDSKPNAKTWKCGSENRTATSPEDKPKRADEPRDRPLAQRHKLTSLSASLAVRRELSVHRIAASGCAMSDMQI
jgi:hypothetical protein